MFTNRKRSVVLVAFAAAVAATAACSGDTTAPPAPVTRLKLQEPLRLDTAAMCPYGWIVQNGVVICEDPGT